MISLSHTITPSFHHFVQYFNAHYKFLTKCERMKNEGNGCKGENNSSGPNNYNVGRRKYLIKY